MKIAYSSDGGATFKKSATLDLTSQNRGLLARSRLRYLIRATRPSRGTQTGPAESAITRHHTGTAEASGEVRNPGVLFIFYVELKKPAAVLGLAERAAGLLGSSVCSYLTRLLNPYN